MLLNRFFTWNMSDGYWLQTFACNLNCHVKERKLFLLYASDSLYIVNEFISSRDLRTVLVSSRMQEHSAVISTLSGAQLLSFVIGELFPIVYRAKIYRVALCHVITATLLRRRFCVLQRKWTVLAGRDSARYYGPTALPTACPTPLLRIVSGVQKLGRVGLSQQDCICINYNRDSRRPRFDFKK